MKAKFFGRKIVSILLALCIIMGMVPTMVVAAMSGDKIGGCLSEQQDSREKSGGSKKYFIYFSVFTPFTCLKKRNML